MAASGGEPTDEQVRRAFPSNRLALLILVVVYIPVCLTFSLLTREWEAPDEASHVYNVEYILQHHSFPRISAANLLESVQPPLYYAFEAGWQRLLGIPAFTPVVVPAKTPPESFAINHLLYSTDYTPSQHVQAVRVHELRIPSMLFGLATVLLTYAAARIVGMRELWALACGLVVALWPKDLVAWSSVTNDALIIPLCSLALVLYLLADRATAQGRLPRRRFHLLAMGAVLGAAAITKLTILPVTVVFFVLALVPALRKGRDVQERLRCVLDVVLAAVAFLVVSGWWFVRNHHLYGQFLATKVSEQHLLPFYLGPIPWSEKLLLNIYPQTMLMYSWYNQPGLGLPVRMNEVLAIFVVPCLLAGAWVMLQRRKWISQYLTPLAGLALLGSIAAGFAAVLLIIKTNGRGDMRDAFLVVTAVATVLVTGSTRILCRISPRLELVGVYLWPVLLFALDVYVLIRILIPFGGL